MEQQLLVTLRQVHGVLALNVALVSIDQEIQYTILYSRARNIREICESLLIANIFLVVN